MYSKAKIAGHPIHPALVAFPIASYVGTLVAFATYAANGHQFWLNLAIALNIIGVGSAILAALPGMVDLGLGIPRGTGAKSTGVMHGALNLGAIGLFSAILPYYVTHWNGPPADSTLGLALSSAGVLLTVASGVLGWTLVQTFHVGVRLTPEQAQEEVVVQQTHEGLHLYHRRSA